MEAPSAANFDPAWYHLTLRPIGDGPFGHTERRTDLLGAQILVQHLHDLSIVVTSEPFFNVRHYGWDGRVLVEEKFLCPPDDGHGGFQVHHVVIFIVQI
jgi:hypothetical protein